MSNFSGNAHRCQVGYRGTMALIFEIGNLMLEQIGHHHATDWPLTPEALRAATRVVGSKSVSASVSTTNHQESVAAASA